MALTREGPLCHAVQAGVEHYRHQCTTLRNGSAGKCRADAVFALFQLEQVRNSPRTLVPALTLALLQHRGWLGRRPLLSVLVAERIVHSGALGAAMGERMSKLRAAYETNYQERCVVACIALLVESLPADLLHATAFAQIGAALSSPDEHTYAVIVSSWLSDLAVYNVK